MISVGEKVRMNANVDPRTLPEDIVERGITQGVVVNIATTRNFMPAEVKLDGQVLAFDFNELDLEKAKPLEVKTYCPRSILKENRGEYRTCKEDCKSYGHLFDVCTNEEWIDDTYKAMRDPKTDFSGFCLWKDHVDVEVKDKHGTSTRPICPACAQMNHVQGEPMDVHDCKVVFYEELLDGTLKSVGQCCCWSASHGKRER